MRNLRERLKAVSSGTQPVRAAPAARPDPYYSREYVFPLHDLCGVEQTTLDEIRACDPLFTGSTWDIRRVLFLDTETTGLSGGAGTVAFEVGVGFINPRGLVIRQYVMRDYSEEAAMLEEIARLVGRFETLVTFNGKTFDLPLLESRMVMNRIRVPLTQMPHLDLLHCARRVYKLRLRRCNLSSLEEAILGQTRSDDLPGSQVPQRYFDYIKTREFALLEDVLRHNLDDVRSLACLTGHLCAVFRNPTQIDEPEDLFSVGKTLLRGGRTEPARACFRILGKSSMSAAAHLHLASSYKKEGDWEMTVSTCLDMIASGENGIFPYVTLAKYYEHIAHDYPRALRYAAGALQYLLNTAPISGMDETQVSSIHKRIDRLRRKSLQALNNQQEE